jgi:rubrerythrin
MILDESLFENTTNNKVVVHLLPDEAQISYGSDYWEWTLNDEGLYGVDGENGIVIMDSRGDSIIHNCTPYSNKEILGGEGSIEETLTSLTGKTYKEFTSTGYSQGDYFVCYYPEGEFSEEWLLTIADTALGMYEIYEVQGNENGNYITQIGDTVIVYDSLNADVKHQIADIIGAEPQDIIIKKPVQKWDYEELDESLFEQSHTREEYLKDFPYGYKIVVVEELEEGYVHKGLYAVKPGVTIEEFLDAFEADDRICWEYDPYENLEPLQKDEVKFYDQPYEFLDLIEEIDNYFGDEEDLEESLQESIDWYGGVQEITRKDYQHFLNCLPPAEPLEQVQGYTGQFLVGEPFMTDDNGHELFSHFGKKGGKYYFLGNHRAKRGSYIGDSEADQDAYYNSMNESVEQPPLWDGKYRPEDITPEYVRKLDMPTSLKLLRWFDKWAEKGVKESVEGDQIAQDTIDSKNANYEADKETTREVRKELARQGIATDENGAPINESVDDSIVKTFAMAFAKANKHILDQVTNGEKTLEQVIEEVSAQSNLLTKEMWDAVIRGAMFCDRTPSTNEFVKGPRGEFKLSSKSVDELKADGYGFHHSFDKDGSRYDVFTKDSDSVAVLKEDTSAKAYAKKLGQDDIQYFTKKNQFNYDVKQVRIDNTNKTYEFGAFKITSGRESTKNGREFDRLIDKLKELGYTEIKKNIKESAQEEYTIEINNEIYCDDNGNAYHFDSYDEASEFIDDNELQNAQVTRQHGKAMYEDINQDTFTDNGLASIINTLIQDEFDAIQQYNDAIVNFETEGRQDLVQVLHDILNEENLHVGQLETLLEQVSGSANSIDRGKAEAETQLNGTTLGESYGDEKYFPYNPELGWTEEDIALHKSIDWKARNYKDYEVAEDSFKGKVYAYGKDIDDKKLYTFHKFIRSNSIFPPYYAAVDFNDNDLLGPMYDGRTHKTYDIHDRYETQEMYDMLSN